MSAKGGISRAHGPFVAKMMDDIEKATADNDKLFISTPHWKPPRIFMSFGKDHVRKMNDAKQKNIKG